MTTLRVVPNNHMVMMRTSNDLLYEDVCALMSNIIDETRDIFFGDETREAITASTDYYLNYVTNGGVYVGYCFVYTFSEEFFNVLIGKNPDGSPRGKWVESEEVESDSWAEQSMGNEFVPEPSLITNTNAVFNPALFNERHFEDNVSQNVLTITRLARNVTQKDIYDTFKVYSTSVNYPRVEILDRGMRVAKITYNPASYDALFALVMLKKVDFYDRVYTVNQLKTINNRE